MDYEVALPSPRDRSRLSFPCGQPTDHRAPLYQRPFCRFHQAFQPLPNQHPICLQLVGARETLVPDTFKRESDSKNAILTAKAMGHPRGALERQAEIVAMEFAFYGNHGPDRERQEYLHFQTTLAGIDQFGGEPPLLTAKGQSLGCVLLRSSLCSSFAHDVHQTAQPAATLTAPSRAL